MKEEKDKLRNRLFDKYFENKDGIILTDLVEMIKPVVNVWQSLHLMLQDNCEFFNEYSHLEKIKVFYKDGCSYLFIKICFNDYLIIDLKNNVVLDKDKVFDKFGEEFFCTNFDEKKLDDNIKFTYFYDFENYDSDISELIAFCDTYKDILLENNKIFYEINIGKALSYINISLVTGKMCLIFQTPDQFLYEQLWINSDLTPSSMQDAQNRIGIDKMMEMFDRIKDITIPIDCIPENVYRQITKDYKKKMLVKE